MTCPACSLASGPAYRCIRRGRLQVRAPMPAARVGTWRKGGGGGGLPKHTTMHARGLQKGFCIVSTCTSKKNIFLLVPADVIFFSSFFLAFLFSLSSSLMYVPWISSDHLNNSMAGPCHSILARLTPSLLPSLRPSVFSISPLPPARNTPVAIPSLDVDPWRRAPRDPADPISQPRVFNAWPFNEINKIVFIPSPNRLSGLVRSAGSAVGHSALSPWRGCPTPFRRG